MGSDKSMRCFSCKHDKIAVGGMENAINTTRLQPQPAFGLATQLRDYVERYYTGLPGGFIGLPSSGVAGWGLVENAKGTNLPPLVVVF